MDVVKLWNRTLRIAVERMGYNRVHTFNKKCWYSPPSDTQNGLKKDRSTSPTSTNDEPLKYGTDSEANVNLDGCSTYVHVRHINAMYNTASQHGFVPARSFCLDAVKMWRRFAQLDLACAFAKLVQTSIVCTGLSKNRFPTEMNSIAFLLTHFALAYNEIISDSNKSALSERVSWKLFKTRFDVS